MQHTNQHWHAYPQIVEGTETSIEKKDKKGKQHKTETETETNQPTILQSI